MHYYDDKTKCDEALLDKLSAASQLHKLFLGTPVEASSFVPLKRLTNLNTLYVNCEKLSEADILALCGILPDLPALSDLAIKNANIPATALPFLAECKPLRVLRFNQHALRIAHSTLFDRLPQIERIMIDDKQYQRPHEPQRDKQLGP